MHSASLHGQGPAEAKRVRVDSSSSSTPSAACFSNMSGDVLCASLTYLLPSELCHVFPCSHFTASCQHNDALWSTLLACLYPAPGVVRFNAAYTLWAALCGLSRCQEDHPGRPRQVKGLTLPVSVGSGSRPVVGCVEPQWSAIQQESRPTHSEHRIVPTTSQRRVWCVRRGFEPGAGVWPSAHHH